MVANSVVCVVMQPPPSSPLPLAIAADKLLAAIIDSSDDAIISKDLTGIVTSWNRGAERTFGYTSEEMVGKPILRLLPPERLNEEATILDRLKRGERVDHFETIRVRKDGSQIHVSLTISPVKSDDGIIVGASKIARNITEQKAATQKLAEAHQQLSRADRMKAEFIATLSHELRTPLNAIAGWVQILRGERTEEDVAHGIEVIDRNVKAQSQLIDDLLDMSRIESGKLILDIQRVDVPSIITAALETVRPSADAKKIRVTTVFASVDGLFKGDKNRLQQVIWNLLTNAIKFTEKDGKIQIGTEKLNSHLAISITDSGSGISPEFLPYIFERFNQADSSTTRRFGGLGLGLSIAKHLVELHGGTIEAHSRGIGHGSTFIIRLPLLPAHPDWEPAAESTVPRRSAPPPEREALELTGIRILVVDDEVDSAEIVRRILEKAGAQVYLANSVNQGLQTYVTVTPDILVSDIGMPERDGYDLISSIRKMRDGRKMPAIALTALARGEDRSRALRAGFQMHVPKPVDGQELIAAIRNLTYLGGAR